MGRWERINLQTTIARTFAALNATNEAILYAKSPEELYEKVSEAAFSSGDFLATAVFLLDPETSLLKFAAGFGDDVPRLRSVDISIVANTPEGSGVCGQAFRDRKACVSNDYLNDVRSQAWRRGAAASHVGAAAALPLICSGRSVGVFMVTRREPHSLDQQIVSLLERMAANVSFALDNFEHEALRKHGEQEMRRLALMFGAFSATNEAILRARTEHDLYQRVCDAAVHDGEALAAVVLLADPDSHWLEPVAGTGEAIELVTQTRFSTDPDNVYGAGICGQAFRTQRPCINNDIPMASGQWQGGNGDTAVMACVAVPLTKLGKAIGVLMFFVGRLWSTDEEVIALMARIAENVSVALDNFERASEKARADAQKELLSRMFAALSATNEAIMRAKTRAELFELVCEAAADGVKFNCATIALVEPGSEFLRVVASNGPSSELMRGLRFAVTDSLPEGRGLVGSAFRTRLPCIGNNFLEDERTQIWHEGARRAGVKSSAVMPLLNGDRVEGVLIFNSVDCGTFTPELVELLQRLAENLAFALGNFDRVDEKARADQRQERLTRMFEALSATNEAIMRAKSRAQLYELVCEAAAKGGRFNSASVFLTRPDDDDLDLAAVAGPTAENVRQLRISTNEAYAEGQGLCGTAFRSRQASIINDFLIDPHSQAFQQVIRNQNGRSGAAFPLSVDGQTAGVMMFVSSEVDTFTSEFVELLQRLADNVSFALGSFARADEKVKTEEQKERLTRMFAALSATNEAIMRAKTRPELFELVCEAAAVGGKFTSTAIVLLRPGEVFLENVSSAGPDRVRAMSVKLSADASRAEGQGLSGIAIRTRKPCISNDYLGDFGAGAHFYTAIRDSGTRSGAALPLLKDGEAIGALVFLSSEIDAFSTEMIGLLERLAMNVSFALDNFDRADEKARADEQKQSLSRMFAALSATNEAIMRAGSRGELYQLVCEAAASGGRFTSTAIALAMPGSDYMEFVASAGPTGNSARQVTLSVNEAHPEGRGVGGIAFRSGQACIFNDYLADPRSQAFHARARADGSRSCAGFPLIVRRQVVGVMLYISLEKDAFTSEFVELLQRLSHNVSFALESFDRADEKSRADERIEYLASHDSLTALPNRDMFNELLRHAIESADRHQRKFAVMFIDLDRFKVINDSLGHEAGDMLLVEVADRLRSRLRASDVVARLGGDEFVVLLEETAACDDVEQIAGDLLSSLSQPLQLSGHECHTSASIGIAMYPDDGADVQALTKNADMAMYMAKEDGKNGFRFFSKEIKTQSIERLRLESALRRALERDQFALHYQPKVDMMSGQITGVEALIRWTHPELGLVSPGQFIPLAEETGLIVPIGRWVLNEACTQNMAWQRRGLRPVTMAVNLSPRQFADEHLLHDVDEALVASGMSPVLLQLEVTESMVMRNVSRAIRVLDAIQNRGIRLAIDDFGTGYSSMSLMKQFPIDTIKVDRSFVRDLAHDTEDQAIAQAIISMGKALGMTVIAEGVETVEQQEFLRQHACDEMQGYLFSKPLPAHELAELLRSAVVLETTPESEHASPSLQPAIEENDAGQSAAQSGRKRAVI